MKWKIPKHSDLIMTDPGELGKTMPAEADIAYADDRNQAKYKVLNHECKTDGELTNDPDIEYLDLSARRLKVCDGLGDEPLSVVAETAMKKADWVWTMDGVEYTADDISDEESLEEFKSLFDE